MKNTDVFNWRNQPSQLAKKPSDTVAKAHAAIAAAKNALQPLQHTSIGVAP